MSEPFYLDIDNPLHLPECAMIGTILASPDSIPEVLRIVDQGQFLHCGLAVMFDLLVQMWVRGEKIDIAEVYENHFEEVDQLGGASRLLFLLQLASNEGPRRAALNMLAAYDQTCAELRDRTEGK